MELEKLERQLKLLALLTQNHSLTIDEIGERLHLNRRSIYRYLDAFKQMGFIVEKQGTHYRIDHRSPFFAEITDRIHFSADEATTIRRLLDSVVDHSPQVRNLRAKLASLYDFGALSDHDIDETFRHNLETLYEAVQTEQMVVLHNYASPHSHAVSTRIVEPYLFLSGNSEVRCYEPSSNMNKTFKVSRAERVELLDVRWANKDKHAPFYTDLFHFSSETRQRVQLRLGTLSASLLLEEYPNASAHLQQQPDGRTLLDIEVCSFKGIGRFVIGLLDDIEVVDSPEFLQYLRERVAFLTQKIQL